MDKKITTNQKNIVKKFIERYEKMEDSFEDIFSIFGVGVIDSKLYDGCYGMLDSCIELISLMLDDTHDWLNWYIYDNECGKKEFKAGYNGNTKKISCLEDILALIEEGYKNSSREPEVDTNPRDHGKTEETEDSKKKETSEKEKAVKRDSD